PLLRLLFLGLSDIRRRLRDLYRCFLLGLVRLGGGLGLVGRGLFDRVGLFERVELLGLLLGRRFIGRPPATGNPAATLLGGLLAGATGAAAGRLDRPARELVVGQPGDDQGD